MIKLITVGKTGLEVGLLLNSLGEGIEGATNAYELFSISSTNKSCIKIPLCVDPEEYEKNIPKIKEFKDIDEVLLIVNGSEPISGITLGLLEQLQSYKVNLLYIKPDISSLSHERQMYHRIAYNVFQEYARSGVIENIILVAYDEIDKMLGGIALYDYYEKINNFIAQHVHMVLVFIQGQPIMDTFSVPLEEARICTLGIVNFDTHEHKLFFPLDRLSEVVYYYAIPQDRLKTDRELLRKIKTQIKKMKERSSRVSYGIFPTQYDEPLVYCWAKTKIIQG